MKTVPWKQNRTIEIVMNASDQGDVALARIKIFPPDLIEAMCVDLGRSLGEYVPPTEAESAIVGLFFKLKDRGWHLIKEMPDIAPLLDHTEPGQEQE
jgi:hypothetical protein